MDDNRARLRRITDDLLSLEHPGQLRAASIELHALCSEITGLSDSTLDPADTTPSLLATGLAIAPLGAARCTLDFARTAQFMRGVHRAIQVAQERFPARPIEILYAGCGPFAPLAIPLMTRFTADDVRFTLLDIHERSLRAAHELVQGFGFEGHACDFIAADATRYRHPTLRPLHVVITETMQRALTREPQVEVTLNLAPQLLAGGILIPECITVDACLYDPSTEFQFVPTDPSVAIRERVRIPLARLMELSLDSVPALLSEGLPVVNVVLPDAGAVALRLMLRTGVRVFESFSLGDYDAGITCPHGDPEFDRLKPGDTFAFHYQLGQAPGFRMQSVG